jgi:hypothetical protein
MSTPALPSARKPAPAVCEAATRNWALASVAVLIAAAVSGALPFFREGGGLAVPFFFVAVPAYWFCHIQLYRAVRDDIVMAPEKNAYFIRILRWYGPAAAVEVLFWVHYPRPERS